MTKTTTSPTEPAASATGTVVMRGVWGICWLMFFSTVMNYMDRQAIALVSPQIRREFRIDFEGFGWVLTSFYLAYALFQVPAGFIVDRRNIWMVYAGAVAFWSLAGMAIAFAPVLGALIIFRALLGVGESFNWPCALRVTSVILPPKDRTLGNGIFNSGAAVGAVLTPLTVPFLTAWFGWREAFVMIGATGFVWVGIWWIATRRWREAGIGNAPPELPTDPAHRGLSRRGWIGFASVLLVVAATILGGYLWPADVPITLDRIEPQAAVQLVEWKVQPGDKVERNKTVLAEFRAGDASALLISPDEGMVAQLLADPGGSVNLGEDLLLVDDTASEFGVPLAELRPLDSARLVLWRTEPNASVRRDEVLADLELGGVPFQLKSAHHAVVDGQAAPKGSWVDPNEALALLRVHGFDRDAHGLPGLWWGIAVLMFGSLVAARLIPLDDLGQGNWARRLGEVARLRRFWILVVVSGTINVCWHFLVNWVPSYLQTDRRMTYILGSVLTAVVFLAADAGNLGGGAASRWLAGRGLSPAKARGRVVTACAILISSGVLVGFVPGGGSWDALIITLLGVMALGTAAFMANYFAYCQEVSESHTGLIVGYLGGLGNLLAAGFFPIAGQIKDVTGTFGPVFLAIGLMPFLGLILLTIGWESRRSPDTGAGLT